MYLKYRLTSPRVVLRPSNDPILEYPRIISDFFRTCDVILKPPGILKKLWLVFLNVETPTLLALALLKPELTKPKKRRSAAAASSRRGATSVFCDIVTDFRD